MNPTPFRLESNSSTPLSGTATKRRVVPAQSPDLYASHNTSSVSFGKLPESLGMTNAENRRLMKGYFLRYGSPLIALGVSFISGPCACCVVPLSAIGLWIAERKGTKVIKSIKKTKLSGIPKNTEHVRQLWESTKLKDIEQKGSAVYQDVRDNYNEIIKTVFKNQQSLKRRLLMRKGKPLDKLAEKMFYVQAIYRDKTIGKIIHWFRTKPTSWPILRFPIFRYPIVAFSWLLQLTLTVFASGKANRLIKKAARRL